jgi:hypothetical protein
MSLIMYLRFYFCDITFKEMSETGRFRQMNFEVIVILHQVISEVLFMYCTGTPWLT